jgi:hypothetical protein
MTIPLVDVDRDASADANRANFHVAEVDVPHLVMAFGFAAAGELWHAP